MAKEKKSKNPKPTKKQKTNYKKRIIGFFIGLVGFFLFIFIIFFTVSRVFRPIDISNFLPADSTIGMVQININERSEHVQRLYRSLYDHEVYQLDSLRVLAEEIFTIDYENEIQPWINRQVGYSLIENGDSVVDTVIFIETKDKEKTLEFMESRGITTDKGVLLTEDYRGNDIYKYSINQIANFTFVRNYLIVSDSQEALKKIIDTDKGVREKLIQSENYNKVAHNLPINNLVFGYADFEKGLEYLKNNTAFMAEKSEEMLAFDPFLKVYKSVGVSVISENQNLAVQSFTYLDEGYLNGDEYLSFDSKFRARLLSMMPKGIYFYAGGQNLQKQLVRLSDLFSNGGEVSYLIFEGMLRAQKNNYFGEEIKLEDDIYPLLQNEYAFAFAAGENQPSTIVMLELSDPQRDKDKIETIVDSFVRKNAVLAPRVVSTELEDGTEMEEIVSASNEIDRQVEDYHGYEMNVLKFGDDTWGVNYIIIDSTLVVTTQKELLHQVIDLVISPDDSFRNGTLFTELVTPVLRSSDEIVYLNLEYLFAGAEMPELLSPYLSPFTHITSGKNYFKDGISSINFIKID